FKSGVGMLQPSESLFQIAADSFRRGCGPLGPRLQRADQGSTGAHLLQTKGMVDHVTGGIRHEADEGAESHLRPGFLSLPEKDPRAGGNSTKPTRTAINRPR